MTALTHAAACRAVVVLLFLVCAAPAAAAERYALVVTGASGAPEYAQRFDQWRTTFVELLLDRYGYPADHVFVLGEREGPGVKSATSQQVRAAMSEIGRRAVRGDVVLVLLMGHGSVFEGDDAKFNLVGPDLDADEWAAIVNPIQGRVVFVNGTGGSSSFLRKLARKDRVVVTATDTIAQRFVTIFPEFFIRAFDDPVADADKDARISLWEAFEYASAGVRGWYEDQGRPATERALLDDTGAGVGREAGAPGADGVLAGTTYLQLDAVATPSGSPDVARLFKRRLEVEAEIEALNGRRSSLSSQAFEASLERLLLELAQIDRAIREKS